MIFKSRPVVLPADRFQRPQASGRPQQSDNDDLQEPFVWKRRWLARLMQWKWLLAGLVLGGLGLAIVSFAYERENVVETKTSLENNAASRDQR